MVEKLKTTLSEDERKALLETGVQALTENDPDALLKIHTQALSEERKSLDSAWRPIKRIGQRILDLIGSVPDPLSTPLATLKAYRRFLTERLTVKTPNLLEVSTLVHQLAAVVEGVERTCPGSDTGESIAVGEIPGLVTKIRFLLDQGELAISKSIALGTIEAGILEPWERGKVVMSQFIVASTWDGNKLHAESKVQPAAFWSGDDVARDLRGWADVVETYSAKIKTPQQRPSVGETLTLGNPLL